jgi:hypothetical protein
LQPENNPSTHRFFRGFVIVIKSSHTDGGGDGNTCACLMILWSWKMSDAKNYNNDAQMGSDTVLNGVLMVDGKPDATKEIPRTWRDYTSLDSKETSNSGLMRMPEPTIGDIQQIMRRIDKDSLRLWHLHKKEPNLVTTKIHRPFYVEGLDEQALLVREIVSQLIITTPKNENPTKTWHGLKDKISEDAFNQVYQGKSSNVRLPEDSTTAIIAAVHEIIDKKMRQAFKAEDVAR